MAVKVEGLNKTAKALQQVGVDIDDLKDVMAAIAAEGARLASAAAPSRTGRLRGTIRGNRAKAKAVVAAGRGKVRYAGAINYGWPARSIKPALFMQKADQQLSTRAVEMLEQGIDDVIGKAGLR